MRKGLKIAEDSFKTKKYNITMQNSKHDLIALNILLDALLLQMQLDLKP